MKQYPRKKGKKKENKAKESSLLPYLPYETLVEILSRLPVKSLLRFKCVSNQWRSLIMDPQFALMHLNRSSQRPGAILWSEESLSFHSIAHELASIEPIDDLPWIDNTYTGGNDFDIIGSCNGLLVVSCSSNLFIWNPSTRYCTKIKRPSVSTLVLYGLGYNHDLNIYKLVMVFDRGFSEKLYANVFSFKSNSWKEIEMVPFRYYYNGLATLVNGVPHWKVSSDIKGDSSSFWWRNSQIFSFDLVEDKFKEVPLPDWSNQDGFWHLFDYNGWLCTTTPLRSSLGIAGGLELWAMKEYGIKESWSKIFIIPILAEIRTVDCSFAKSGKLLLHTDWGQTLFIYNPKEGAYEVTHFTNSKHLDLTLFVESLVCLGCVVF